MPGGCARGDLHEQPQQPQGVRAVSEEAAGHCQDRRADGSAPHPCLRVQPAHSLGLLDPQLGRQIGFIPLVFCGVGGLLYGPPKPVPLNVVVGKPISVPDLQTLLLQKDSTQSKGDSS
eukprot:CAMPEP_0175033000 /NCGR_PEP_ID=MMETSP0005-20121125/21747_1 /TAXON_ID=420556 /ORGANISM="Ochromonas sp., Strain CCMP1393" /LENGTH=117 /DNA_ID=CAMNT_0016293551 /DNA_START=450 /DNA_END=800 /DNA_ORIENTATION=+